MTNKLVAYTCKFGVGGALVLSRFEEFLDRLTLTDRDKAILLRAMIGTIELASGDAGREVQWIRNALYELARNRSLLRDMSEIDCGCPCCGTFTERIRHCLSRTA